MQPQLPRISSSETLAIALTSGFDKTGADLSRGGGSTSPSGSGALAQGCKCWSHEYFMKAW